RSTPRPPRTRRSFPRRTRGAHSSHLYPRPGRRWCWRRGVRASGSDFREASPNPKREYRRCCRRRSPRRAGSAWRKAAAPRTSLPSRRPATRPLATTTNGPPSSRLPYPPNVIGAVGLGLGDAQVLQSGLPVGVSTLLLLEIVLKQAAHHALQSL